MSRVRVKICGVRSIEEAEAAVDAGADALGFNFWPLSSRYIDPKAAQVIIDSVSPLVPCVGVFVNEGVDLICSTAAMLGLAAVQLHGDETPEFCSRLKGLRLIKALRVGRGFDPASITRYQAGAILLDANVNGSYGGTGQVFDWRGAIEAKAFASIILAGGLNVDNVADAINQVRPFAIDVCSGVEAEPGRKDFVKLRRFLTAVDEANRSFASSAARDDVGA
jgi:phosphoribosylanthranilate isomerase